MKHKVQFLLFFFLISALINAKDNEITQFADSLQINEVVVTGTRSSVNINNLPMSVSIVGHEQIENRFEQSLLPVITEEVPGLFITSRGIMGYGVSTGAAGGMTIRGVGAGPTTQVLLLIDGHPQYMGLMGHPLADSYQSLLAERVEVVRGPASVLYGSNAMGGVINIITKEQKQDGVFSNLRTLYGSYNTFSGEVNNSVRKGKLNTYLSLNYNHSDGHRNNMDFDQYGGYAKIGYDFTVNWKAFADLNLTHFDASNPGKKATPMIDNDAEITRGVASFSLENKFDNTSGALKFFYNFGRHKINDGYTTGGMPQDKLFRSNDKMLGVSLFQTYSFFKGNKTTAGFDFQHVGGHAWNTFFDERPNSDIVEKSFNEFAGYVNFQQFFFDKLILNGGLRVDNHEWTGTEIIPQAGISYLLSEATTFKGIVSKGFRNPTIREMYMFPPQNPDLKSERMMNYELSASQKLLEHRLNLDLSIYYINGDNVIQTITLDNGSKLNVNGGKIENYGMEFAFQYQIMPSLSASGNYSYLHMKHKLLASPEHKLYVGANYRKDKWLFSSGLQYIHGLYVDESYETTEAFALWNVQIAYKLGTLAELFVKGENLLAQRYEINEGYPMPKATVFGGVNLKF